MSSSTCSRSRPSRENADDARGLGAILQGEFNLLGAKELFFQMAERAVVEHFAAVDDHDAATEFLDVVEVVGGEQDGGVEFAIDGAKELANVIFRDDVEADGGLVEKKERGIVEQRGGQDRSACVRRAKACARACAR